MAKPIIVSSYGPLDEAVEAFQSGEVVAYPTETFYGLAVDPLNEDALKKLFSIKDRDLKNPISLIVSDKSKVFDYAVDAPGLSRKLMDRFWPGPLTIVFKARPGVSELLTAGTGTVAIRVSSNPVAIELAREAGSAITATSANASGKPPTVSADGVVEYFGGKVSVVIDGGEVTGGKGSTIVDITGKTPKIVREGVVDADEILMVY